MNLNETIKQDLIDLRILPDRLGKNETLALNKTFILSIKPEEYVFNTFTHNEKDSQTLLAIYFSEEIKDLGFRIKNATCWSHFETMMKHDDQVKLVLRLE